MQADADDDLDLDRRVERQHGYADGGARVHAGVAERPAEQLGGAVRDLRLAGEVRGRRHEHDDLDDLRDPVEVADLDFTAAIALSAHCCAHATASSGLTSPPTLPVDQQLAVLHRQLAGGEDQVAGDARPGRTPPPASATSGTVEAELGQPLLDGAHDSTGRLK